MKRVLFVLFALSFFGLSFNSRAAAETPTPAPPLQTSDTQNTGVLDTASLRTFSGVRWRANVGAAVIGAPLYVDGQVYVATQTSGIKTFDAVTGHRGWSTRDPQVMPLSAPLIFHNGMIYAGGSNGLAAVDSQTGATRWLFATPLIFAPPLIVDDTIYIGDSSGVLHALDLTGTERWAFDTKQQPIVQGAVYADDVLYQVAGSILYALNPQTGTEIWNVERQFWYPIALYDGVIYGGNNDQHLYAINASAGEIEWALNSTDSEGAAWSSPIVTEDRVYIGSKSEHFYALDRQNGDILWDFPTVDWAVTQPFLADGVIYFGVGNHDMQQQPSRMWRFYALDAQDGHEIWSYAVPDRILAGAAVTESAIFVITIYGNVYALE